MKKTILKLVSALDLGCGTGVVGLSLWLKGLSKEPIITLQLLKQNAILSSQNSIVPLKSILTLEIEIEIEIDIACHEVF